MQKAVMKLRDIGTPPEGFTGSAEFPSDETLDLWDEYQDAVESISQPVTWEEAEILIKCCPTDRMAGIEHSLLHSIESCTSTPDGNLLETPDGLEKYKKLINGCNSAMMKEMLLKRLEAYSQRS